MLRRVGRVSLFLVSVLVFAGLSGCAAAPDGGEDHIVPDVGDERAGPDVGDEGAGPDVGDEGAAQDGSQEDATPDASQDHAMASGVTIEVHRSETCACCGNYEDYLLTEGFEVRTVLTEELAAFKDDLGIPAEMSSCHTALVDGYFVEGHVPAEAIEALLLQRPDVDGIALPGMPAGSPGMGGVKDETWTVFSVSDGTTTASKRF